MPQGLHVVYKCRKLLWPRNVTWYLTTPRILGEHAASPFQSNVSIGSRVPPDELHLARS